MPDVKKRHGFTTDRAPAEYSNDYTQHVPTLRSRPNTKTWRLHK
jgi:hypothetical protein